MRYLPDDNLSYPVLISGKEIGSASGFYINYDQSLYIVTAGHVLFEEDQDSKEWLLQGKIITLSSYARDLSVKTPIIVKLNLELLDVKKHPTADIAVIKLANITGEVNNVGSKVEWLKGVAIKLPPEAASLVGVPSEFFRKYDAVLISNEVFVFGYPNSIGVEEQGQIDYSRPLLRKGIVAGKNDLKKTIIIDCPVYYGNSGGLVIEVEDLSARERKFYAIGIVVQFIPFVEQLLSLQHKTININMENSGYAVVEPIDTILELIEAES